MTDQFALQSLSKWNVADKHESDVSGLRIISLICHVNAYFVFLVLRAHICHILSISR